MNRYLCDQMISNFWNPEEGLRTITFEDTKDYNKLTNAVHNYFTDIVKFNEVIHIQFDNRAKQVTVYISERIVK